MNRVTVDRFVNIAGGQSTEWLARHGSEVVDYLKDKNHWTWREMEESTGVNYSLLCYIHLGKKNMTLRVAKLLLKHLSTRIEDGE